MFIQFDGEIDDLAAFEEGLHMIGVYPLSVRLSRWIRVDPDTQQESDAGPRIDIEMFRQAYPLMAPKILALQQYVAASPHVISTAGGPPGSGGPSPA